MMTKERLEYLRSTVEPEWPHSTVLKECVDEIDRLRAQEAAVIETVAMLRADLDATARAVAADVMAERDELLSRWNSDPVAAAYRARDEAISAGRTLLAALNMAKEAIEASTDPDLHLAVAEIDQAIERASRRAGR